MEHYRNQLIKATQVVNQTEANFNKLLLERNEILYTEETGLHATAKDVKNYVKSVYGAKAPEYKHLRSIEFRRITH
ncbi:hypothetical protein [Galbibacter mesophilus]|uniref:hypothetical protein n=1 Tax=Galbibacter mesophilus TaxID=379069 RepID=UPI00191D9081|nr:hypothetical protein [Galbibacter mesophilus]MCM5663674.1 hypothetical protein [Galbibacter mesophilus]